MSRAQPVAGLLAVIGLILGASGCTTGPGPQQPSPSVVLSSSPSVAPTGPTVTPTTEPTDPVDPNEAAVIALIKRYYATNNKIRTNRSVPVSRYKSVTTGEYYELLRDAVRASRARGERASGGVKVVGEPAVSRLTPRGAPMSARVIACIDVRGAKLVDREGRSRVSKDRSPFYVEQATAKKTKSSGWRISNVTNRGTKKC